MSLRDEKQALTLEIEHKSLAHKLEFYQKEIKNLLKEQRDADQQLLNYKNLHEMMPVGSIHLCRKGLIRVVNKRAQILLEKDKRKLINRCFSRFVHPDSLYVFSKFRLAILKNKLDSACEIKCLKQNNSSCFPVRLDGQVIKNIERDEDELVLRMTDITKESQLEEALKEEQLKVQILSEYCASLLSHVTFAQFNSNIIIL